MERLAFLLEDSQTWVRCLLNPEGIRMHREAGVHEPAREGLPILGSQLSDDPLLFGGGGRTLYDLQLLFDVSMARKALPDDDIRHLTAPVVSLAENSNDNEPPIVRLIWGKRWNIPGIVLHVAERYDHFNTSGIPRRSFMSMRFARIDESAVAMQQVSAEARNNYSHGKNGGKNNGKSTSGTTVHTGTSRLDQIASSSTGNPRNWRAIAAANNIANPQIYQAKGAFASHERYRDPLS